VQSLEDLPPINDPSATACWVASLRAEHSSELALANILIGFPSAVRVYLTNIVHGPLGACSILTFGVGILLTRSAQAMAMPGQQTRSKTMSVVLNLAT
jgi:hypothetical protein